MSAAGRAAAPAQPALGPVGDMGCWSGGLSAGCLAGVGVWFGEAAEGDFETEGAELADVVGDLPACAGLALVVVRAKILIPQAGTAGRGRPSAGCCRPRP